MGREAIEAILLAGLTIENVNKLTLKVMAFAKLAENKIIAKLNVFMLLQSISGCWLLVVVL